MTSNNENNAGEKSRINSQRNNFDINMIERFYFCVVIAVFLLKQDVGHDNVSSVKINLYLLNWLKQAEKKESGKVMLLMKSIG